MFAFQRHELPGHPANGGALHIQPDTGLHRLHIFFLQAGNGAMFTSRSALVAGFDTLLMFGMHNYLHIFCVSFKCAQNIPLSHFSGGINLIVL